MQGQAAFVGSVPEKYDRYMGPIFFEQYADDLVKRISAFPGMRVLELACGTGIVTRRLRDALPVDARLVATDLNEDMITQARSRFSQTEGVEWRQADATRLPFSDEMFDLVVCQFGVMFFPDKLAAFREASRVLVGGGVFLFNVWSSIEENQLSLVVAETVAALYPADPPDFYNIPFGFHDQAQISALLSEAGFENLSISTVRKRGVAASANDAAVALIEGTPMVAQIVARSRPSVSEVVNATAKAIGERLGDKPVRSDMTALVCTTRKREASTWTA